jgi:hypothetical protein
VRLKHLSACAGLFVFLFIIFFHSFPAVCRTMDVTNLPDLRGERVYFCAYYPLFTPLANFFHNLYLEIIYMTFWLKVSLVVGIVAAVGAASPACVTGTYTSYQALGAGGCTLGDETFDNFSLLSFSNSLGVSSLSTDQILVTPSLNGLEDSLAYSYQTGAGGTPITITVNQPGQTFAFNFLYQAQIAGPNTLGSLQMTSDFSNTSPGSASASKNAQLAGGGPIFTSSVTDGGASNPAATYSGPITAVTGGGGLFNVGDAISLQAQAGSASSTGFTNNFFETTPTSDAPEAATVFLLGGGLLIIGFIHRRTASRATL